MNPMRMKATLTILMTDTKSKILKKENADGTYI